MSRKVQESLQHLQQSWKYLYQYYNKESLSLLKEELFEHVVKSHFPSLCVQKANNFPIHSETRAPETTQDTIRTENSAPQISKDSQFSVSSSTMSFQDTSILSKSVFSSLQLQPSSISSIDTLYHLHDTYYWPVFCHIQDHYLQYRHDLQDGADRHGSSSSRLGRHDAGTAPGAESDDAESSSNTNFSRIPGTKPFLIGVSAPQGCGKTTMTDLMRKFFLFQSSTVRHKLVLNCIAMSLDDFYLTGKDQDELATTFSSNNPLLQYRGNGKYI